MALRPEAMDVRWMELVLGACLACAGLLGAAVTVGAPTAAAAPQAATVDVVEPGPSPVALKTGPGGKAYWELKVVADGSYIASWERSSGLWGTPAEALTSLEGMYACRNKAILAYVSQFAGYRAFLLAPGVKHDPTTGLTFTDPATAKATAACEKDSRISTDQVTLVKDMGAAGKPRPAVIQIPAALTGPGTHELFIAGYSLLDRTDPACPRKTWAPRPGVQGGIVSGRCNPSFTTVRKFTVTIPRSTSPTVLGGPVVEPGSWFEPSPYSNFRAIDAAAVTAGPSGVWPMAGPALLLGVVLALLLAVPTAVLAAVAGDRPGRLASVVRRLVLPDVGSPASAPGHSTPGRRFSLLGQVLLGQVHGPLAFLIVVLCSALAAAGQKGFGWNERSARLAMSFFLAFMLLNYGSIVFRWGIARRHRRGSFPRVAARPVYVAVLLASLAVARVADLEPALVFGAVLGVDYSFNAGEAGPRRPALAAVAGSVYMAVLGLVAWAAYSFLAANRVETFIRWQEIQPDYVAAVSDAGGFATLAVGELLAIIAVVAIAALPVTLLPFARFEGELIWRWRRGAWILCCAVAVAMFSLILRPLPGSADAKAVPSAPWVCLYAAYGLLALGLWAFLATGRRRQGLPLQVHHEDETPAPKVGAGVER